MREIWFRGKRIDNDEWAEGFYVHIPCGRFLCDEHMIQTVEDDGRIGQLHNVYEYTVGQFTGLTDKDGKKIFEGDIVNYHCGENVHVGIIRMGEYTQQMSLHLGFNVEWVSLGCDYFRRDIRFWTACREIEVIGNIHDNPELLEAK